MYKNVITLYLFFQKQRDKKERKVQKMTLNNSTCIFYKKKFNIHKIYTIIKKDSPVTWIIHCTITYNRFIPVVYTALCVS